MIANATKSHKYTLFATESHQCLRLSRKHGVMSVNYTGLRRLGQNAWMLLVLDRMKTIGVRMM